MKKQKLTQKYVESLNKFSITEDNALDSFKQLIKPGEKVIIKLPSFDTVEPIQQFPQETEIVDAAAFTFSPAATVLDKEENKKEAPDKDEVASLNAQLAAKVREAAALAAEYEKVVALGPSHWGPAGEIVKNLFKSKSKAEEEQINLVVKIHGL